MTSPMIERARPVASEKHSSTTLHAHGDGTYHTTQGYESGRKEHPSFGHAVAHMAKNHAEGDHMHIEGHEDGYTTHSVHDGKVHGPEEHKTMGELKRHVADCMDGDCGE